MKIFTIIIIFLFLNLAAKAQSFRIDSESKYTGSVGSQVKAVINIRNLTNKPLHLQIKRLDGHIGSSQSSFFCWGDDCFGSNAISFPFAKTIESGKSSLKFTSVLEAGLAATVSSVKYLIYDVNNPADSVVHEISYVIEDQNSKKLLFENRDIQISNIYPNPVDNYAFLNYNFYNKNLSARIVIHNVLGSIIGEYELPSFETRLKISTNELNPGIYFYTLRVENDNIITKKLVVKR
ncbi:hypothetical protein BH23BAC1_BH23BAC1_11140 [soil metagenome]